MRMIPSKKVVFLLMFLAIGVLTIKKPSFITPDGISPTLNTVEVNSTKSNRYITSSIWIPTPTCPTYGRGFIETQPGPSMKSFLKKRGFKILHNNINGILTKMVFINPMFETKNIQTFGFTESHLNASISDNEISIDGYFIERLDRKKGTHGGVICYIRDDVVYERRKDLETDGIEAIWLEITLPKSSPLLICFAYKPPEGSRHTDKNFLAKFEIMLEIVLEGKETLLAGDLNVNNLI